MLVAQYVETHNKAVLHGRKKVIPVKIYVPTNSVTLIFVMDVVFHSIRLHHHFHLLHHLLRLHNVLQTVGQVHVKLIKMSHVQFHPSKDAIVADVAFQIEDSMR